MSEEEDGPDSPDSAGRAEEAQPKQPDYAWREKAKGYVGSRGKSIPDEMKPETMADLPPGHPQYRKPTAKGENVIKPKDTSLGDWVRKPNKALAARMRRLAYLAVYGRTHSEIATELKMSPEWVRVMLTNSKVKEQIAHYEDRLFEEDIQKRMQDLGPDAIDAMTDILRNSELAPEKKESAAKWMLEKLTGKATQPVETRDASLSNFLKLLKDMKDSGQVLDVGEGAPQEKLINDAEGVNYLGEGKGATEQLRKEEAPQKDSFADWLDENF